MKKIKINLVKEQVQNSNKKCDDLSKAYEKAKLDGDEVAAGKAWQKMQDAGCPGSDNLGFLKSTPAMSMPFSMEKGKESLKDYRKRMAKKTSFNLMEIVNFILWALVKTKEDPARYRDGVPKSALSTPPFTDPIAYWNNPTLKSDKRLIGLLNSEWPSGPRKNPLRSFLRATVLNNFLNALSSGTGPYGSTLEKTGATNRPYKITKKGKLLEIKELDVFPYMGWQNKTKRSNYLFGPTSTGQTMPKLWEEWKKNRSLGDDEYFMGTIDVQAIDSAPQPEPGEEDQPEFTAESFNPELPQRIINLDACDRTQTEQTLKYGQVAMEYIYTIGPLFAGHHLIRHSLIPSISNAARFNRSYDPKLGKPGRPSLMRGKFGRGIAAAAGFGLGYIPYAWASKEESIFANFGDVLASGAIATGTLVTAGWLGKFRYGAPALLAAGGIFAGTGIGQALTGYNTECAFHRAALMTAIGAGGTGFWYSGAGIISGDLFRGMKNILNTAKAGRAFLDPDVARVFGGDPENLRFVSDDLQYLLRELGYADELGKLADNTDIFDIPIIGFLFKTDEAGSLIHIEAQLDAATGKWTLGLTDEGLDAASYGKALDDIEEALTVLNGRLQDKLAKAGKSLFEISDAKTAGELKEIMEMVTNMTKAKTVFDADSLRPLLDDISEMSQDVAQGGASAGGRPLNASDELFERIIYSRNKEEIAKNWGELERLFSYNFDEFNKALNLPAGQQIDDGLKLKLIDTISDLSKSQEQMLDEVLDLLIDNGYYIIDDIPTLTREQVKKIILGDGPIDQNLLNSINLDRSWWARFKDTAGEKLGREATPERLIRELSALRASFRGGGTGGEGIEAAAVACREQTEKAVDFAHRLELEWLTGTRQMSHQFKMDKIVKPAKSSPEAAPAGQRGQQVDELPRIEYDSQGVKISKETQRGSSFDADAYLDRRAADARRKEGDFNQPSTNLDGSYARPLQAPRRTQGPVKNDPSLEPDGTRLANQSEWLPDALMKQYPAGNISKADAEKLFDQEKYQVAIARLLNLQPGNMNRELAVRLLMQRSSREVVGALNAAPKPKVALAGPGVTDEMQKAVDDVMEDLETVYRFEDLVSGKVGRALKYKKKAAMEKAKNVPPTKSEKKPAWLERYLVLLKDKPAAVKAAKKFDEAGYTLRSSTRPTDEALAIKDEVAMKAAIWNTVLDPQVTIARPGAAADLYKPGTVGSKASQRAQAARDAADLEKMSDMELYKLEFPDNEFGDAAYYLSIKGQSNGTIKKAYNRVFKGRLVVDKSRFEKGKAAYTRLTREKHILESAEGSEALGKLFYLGMARRAKPTRNAAESFGRTALRAIGLNKRKLVIPGIVAGSTGLGLDHAWDSMTSPTDWGELSNKEKRLFLYGFGTAVAISIDKNSDALAAKIATEIRTQNNTFEIALKSLRNTGDANQMYRYLTAAQIGGDSIAKKALELTVKQRYIKNPQDNKEMAVPLQQSFSQQFARRNKVVGADVDVDDFSYFEDTKNKINEIYETRDRQGADISADDIKVILMQFANDLADGKSDSYVKEMYGKAKTVAPEEVESDLKRAKSNFLNFFKKFGKNQDVDAIKNWWGQDSDDTSSPSTTKEEGRRRNNKEVIYMGRNEIKNMIKEAFYGKDYAKYPYNPGPGMDSEEPDEDYIEDWKKFQLKVIQDPTRMESVKLAKLLVNDLELLSDVMDLIGQNKSLGYEFLAKTRKLDIEKRKDIQVS